MKASTLVLVGEAEFDLEVSTSQVTFADWARSAAAAVATQMITVALIQRENDDAGLAATGACVPLVITAPFTQRFRLAGPAALAAPLMPLLEAARPLAYSVEFVRPLATESDGAWDNFQDQVVIQTRLGTLLVVLQALKEPRADEPAFSPHALPSVKAPPLKLFEYIERNHRHCGAARRAPEKVSESFNSSKKRAESALAPIRPRSPVASLPPVSSRPNSGEGLPSARLVSRPSSGATSAHLPVATADVSNQAEARAVILRMRARRSTRTGANSLAPPREGGQAQVEDAFPESRLDSTARAALDAFNHLVESVKGDAVRDRAAAKSELDFYRQFLPSAPSDATSRDDPSARGVSAQQLLVVGGAGSQERRLASVSTASVAAAALAGSALTGHAKLSKPQVAARGAGRLPTLPATPPSPAALAEIGGNQELSPVRTAKPTSTGVASGTKARAKPAASGGRQAELQASSSSARTSSKRTPQQAPHHLQQQGGQRTKPVSKSSKPLASDKKQQQQLRAAMSARESDVSSLSDFDDPDPEVDDAPLLPDDLAGMRAGAAIGGGDDDDDEY